MKIIKSFCLVAALVGVNASLLSSPVLAQDGEAPCGRDANGYPLQCTKPDPSANLESACLTTASLEYCLPYHKNSCEIRGFQLACKVYQMGANCYGGDPNICNYYKSLLRANTDCALNGNQNACAWLQQQNL